MTAGPLKEHCKRVCFDEGNLTVVHRVEPLDAIQIQELFYHDADYERFRFERNVEIERSIRKQLQSFRRATQRSSVDLMTSSSSLPPFTTSTTTEEVAVPPLTTVTTSGPLPDNNNPDDAAIIMARVGRRRQPPRRTRHNASCWQKSPASGGSFPKSVNDPAVALAA